MGERHSPICACKECINHRKYNPYYPFVFDEDKKPKHQRYIFEKALTSELDELCELYGIHKSFTKALITKIEQSKLFLFKPSDEHLLERSFRQLTCDKCETLLGYTKGLHDDWVVCITCKKKLKEKFNDVQ